MKKFISVLLCFALMFTFMTVIASAADGETAEAGAETLFEIITKLLANVDWASILSVFTQTIQTLLSIFGGAA